MANPLRETLLTADDLYGLPSPSGERYELIDGVLEVREPPGVYHGYITGNLTLLVGAWARKHGSGRVLVGDVGFITRPDRRTVRAPDFAYYSYERLPPGTPPTTFGETAPELVVEVLSPGDRAGEVAAKAAMWLAFGVLAVWVVDPDRRSVWVVTPARETTFHEGDVLSGGDALPGFAAPVAEIFDG
jgi:Uma2 family endonuclease